MNARIPERPLDPPEVRTPQPSAADLLCAREELAARIVSGGRVNGLSRLDILDIEANEDFTAFLQDIDRLFESLEKRRMMPYEANDYLTKIAMRHIPADAVERRALRNLNDREEM